MRSILTFATLCFLIAPASAQFQLQGGTVGEPMTRGLHVTPSSPVAPPPPPPDGTNQSAGQGPAPPVAKPKADDFGPSVKVKTFRIGPDGKVRK